MRKLTLTGLKRVWNTAVREIAERRPGIADEIADWESNRPENCSVEDFYADYVWAVYCAGFKIEILEKLWSGIQNALYDFDVNAIAENLDEARENLLTVIRNSRKADCVLDTATVLARNPEIWERIQTMTADAALEEIQHFKGVGPVNSYHIVRNLGWAVAHHGGLTEALADGLGVDCDTLMEQLSRASGKRVSTVDWVMRIWRREVHESDEETVDRFRALVAL